MNCVCRYPQGISIMYTLAGFTSIGGILRYVYGIFKPIEVDIFITYGEEDRNFALAVYNRGPEFLKTRIQIFRSPFDRLFCSFSI